MKGARFGNRNFCVDLGGNSNAQSRTLKGALFSWLVGVLTTRIVRLMYIIRSIISHKRRWGVCRCGTMTEPCDTPVRGRAGEGLGVSLVTPPPVRRRLTRKTPALAGIDRRGLQACAVLPCGPDGEEPVAFVGEDPEETGVEDALLGGASPESQAWQNRFYGSLRRWMRRQHMQVSEEVSGGRFVNPLRALNMEQRASLVQQWASSDDKADPAISAMAVRYYTARKDPNASIRWLHARGVLLTWNGSWGEYSFADLGLQSPYPTTALLCEFLRELPSIVALQREFEECLLAWGVVVGFEDVAYSLELCHRTYEVATNQTVADTDPKAVQKLTIRSEPVACPEKTPMPIRVHIHAFFRNCLRAMQVYKPEILNFKGACPFKSQLEVGRGGRMGCKTAQGMYYVQCPKKGMVKYGGSVLPFQDYLVNGDWPLNLLQQGKMTEADCRAEIVKSAKNLPRLLQNLERLQRERGLASVQVAVRRTEAILEADRHAFRKMAVVDAWLESFSQCRPRYKFLVLEGPSMVGKTHFARSLSPSGTHGVLEVDCAGKEHPDLREFDQGRHDTVIFDECSASAVLLHKKLFQASASMVSLGSSATNMHCYHIWAHRMRLIVTSNRWSLEIRKLPTDDHAWLVANTVHVLVHEPLFEQ